MCYVYVLTFTRDNNEFFYVGQCKNFEKRLKRHLRDLKFDRHHNSNLQDVYNDGFRLSSSMTISCVSSEYAYDLEQRLIIKSKDDLRLLNININNDTLSRNKNRTSIISKIKESVNLRNSEMSVEERKTKWGKSKELNPMYGKTHNQKTKDKISKRVKAFNLVNPGYLKGIKRSESTRLKMTAIAKTRYGDKNPFFGKTHSQKTRDIIAQAARGRKPNNRIKISVGSRIYDSYGDAATELNLNVTVVRHRVLSKNPKFNDWKKL